MAAPAEMHTQQLCKRSLDSVWNSLLLRVDPRRRWAVTPRVCAVEGGALKLRSCTHFGPAVPTNGRHL
jgi:hypothetical protein